MEADLYFRKYIWPNLLYTALYALWLPSTFLGVYSRPGISISISFSGQNIYNFDGPLKDSLFSSTDTAAGFGFTHFPLSERFKDFSP